MYLFASPILAQHLKRVKEAAMHSTCLDKHVGCVILNCPISGQPEIVYGANIDERRQCLALGHCRKQDGLSCPAIHAEICALQQLGELRNKAEGRHRICFCTLEPCEDCTKQLIAAGVQEVFFMQHTRRPGYEAWKLARGTAGWSHVEGIITLPAGNNADGGFYMVK